MIDLLISPGAISVIIVLMIIEALILLNRFRRRKDKKSYFITIGNTLAGVCLMAAVASEMAGMMPVVTGICLLGALAGHLLEVWLRLRR